jgi:flagellar biosynthetic protein FliQ
MDSYSAIEMGREAVLAATILVAPLLGIALLLAIGLGLLQSLFQVHDQTASYVPKVILMLVALALCLPWMTGRLIDYSRQQFATPRMGWQATGWELPESTSVEPNVPLAPTVSTATANNPSTVAATDSPRE